MYSKEDEEEVFQHLYQTLTAAIDYFTNAKKIANPEDGPKYDSWSNTLLALHTDIEERWVDHDAQEEEEAKVKEEDARRADGLATFATFGADIMPIIKSDAEEQMKETEQFWQSIKDENTLPPGWPLDYV